MKILATILGAALAGGLTTMGAMHAKHGGDYGRHGGGGAMMMPHIVDEMADEILDGASGLNLTEDQKQRVISVRDRVKSQAAALHVAHDATHEELKKEWDAASMDTVKMHTMVDARVDELRGVLQTAVDGVVEIHDTLTPAQRKTLTERFEARHGEK